MTEMRYFILLVALFSQANAMEATGNKLVLQSQEHHNQGLVITADPANDCTPAMQVVVLHESNSDDSWPISVVLRVDRATTHTVEGVVMQGPTAQVANLGLMEGPIGSTLYTEMRRGNTLRLKYPTDLGGYEYSSYSLIGFTRNIRRAVSNCKENSRYFTKSDNSLYL